MKQRPGYEAPSAGAPIAALDDKHMMDYVRVVYKRRWIAMAAFLVLFVIGTVNALRQTPVYQASVQLLIETDTPKVARLDQMFQSDNYYAEEFRQTQYRILQSRSLAKGTIDAMKLWDAPKLGNGPDPKSAISVTGLAWRAVFTAIDLAKKPFSASAPEPVEVPTAQDDGARKLETARQSARIDQFLSGLSIVPARNSRIVEVRYASTDPQFAAAAANAVVKMYIQQNMESRFSTSKDAADFLSEKAWVRVHRCRVAEQETDENPEDCILDESILRGGHVRRATSRRPEPAGSHARDFAACVRASGNYPGKAKESDGAAHRHPLCRV